MQSQSESSSTPFQSSGQNLPVALKWTTREFTHFDVEYTDKAGDVVYHFWPKLSDVDFPADFGEDLERAFQAVCPPGADVRADYTDRQEATALFQEGCGLMRALYMDLFDRLQVLTGGKKVETSDIAALRAQMEAACPKAPQPTFWVSVKGMGQNPMADTFLKNEVFLRLDTFLTERYPHVDVPVIRNANGPREVREGNRDRLRSRGKRK